MSCWSRSSARSSRFSADGLADASGNAMGGPPLRFLSGERGRVYHPRMLPPLISSDGHLEVRPERWTPRMPAALRDKAPRTIKLPDGGDAILIEGQAPYPAP